MAVRTKEELLETIRTRIGDDTSDETIALFEDISDTFDDYDNRVTDPENWRQRFEDNDREWREKYRNRFFSGEPTTEPEPEPEPEPIKKYTYDELFTESEVK